LRFCLPSTIDAAKIYVFIKLQKSCAVYDSVPSELDLIYGELMHRKAALSECAARPLKLMNKKQNNSKSTTTDCTVSLHDGTCSIAVNLLHHTVKYCGTVL